MESVSCHQKGLVMGNILWSVDKKIYSDKEDHTLAITGWEITRDQSECDFILYDSPFLNLHVVKERMLPKI